MEKYIWCLIVVSFHNSKLQYLSEVSGTQQEAIMTKVTINQVFWGFQRISSKTKQLSEMPQEVIGFPIYMELEGGLAQFVEGQLLTWGEFSCNQYAAYFQPVIPHLFP